jgi:flagella basal body P-ring formation protein FlgA
MGGRWLVMGGRWLVMGGRWLVMGGRWLVGTSGQVARVAALLLLIVFYSAVSASSRPLTTAQQRFLTNPRPSTPNPQAAALPHVRVAAESIAQKELLTLGDIAVVEAEETVAARLRGIAIGYAPNLGVVRQLNRERLTLLLSAAGFPPSSVRLHAPPVALIRRAAQTLAPELVRAAVERVALAELQASGATARLARLDLPPLIEAPAGAIEVRAALGGVRDVFAPFSVGIEVWQMGRVIQRLSTTAQVEAFAPVLVAARTLPPHVRLRKDDVTLEVRRLERPVALYLRDEQRLRGTSLQRALARGEVLTTDLLLAEYVIKPGDAVRILSEADRVQIAAQGEARAAGRIGDRIQVKNNQSGLLLQAVVVDEGLVRVRF